MLLKRKSARSPEHYRTLSFRYELTRDKTQVSVGVFLISTTKVCIIMDRMVDKQKELNMGKMSGFKAADA